LNGGFCLDSLSSAKLGNFVGIAASTRQFPSVYFWQICVTSPEPTWLCLDSTDLDEAYLHPKISERQVGFASYRLIQPSSASTRHFRAADNGSQFAAEVSANLKDYGSMKSSDSSFDETKIFDEDTSKDRRTNLEVDRARRAKKRMAAQRLEELGMSGDEALSWLIDLDNYLPDPNCLTLGEGLKERFEAALKEQASLKNRLFFRHSEASSYDALSDVNKVFYGSKTLESLCDSEADLMFGMATADRYGAAYLKAAEEMFALKDLALAEVVRRRTLAECARYRLPKPFITMHAVLVAAGMKRDDYRFQSTHPVRAAA
jgi:hypothetical protein